MIVVLDDYGRQRGADAHLLGGPQSNRPEHFSETRRIDVVSEIADANDGEQTDRRNHFDRTQEVVPAPSPRPDSHKVDRDAG